MRWTRTVQRVSVGAALLWGLVAGPLSSLAQEPGTANQEKAPGAEIISPKEDAQVPYKVFVKGRVAAGYHPFLAVAPLAAAPRTWIQPPIPAAKKDGTFNGMVYVGTERAGVGEKFNLFIFAHPNKKRFKEGEVLMEVPDDCVVSDPVTVLRTQ